MKLEGKTALVTGAGGGLGEAIGLLFAREGADIAVANAALFLVSDEARHITGVNLPVDGGILAKG